MGNLNLSLSMSSLLESVPLHAGVKILAEHASGLVAVDKPEGVLSHPNGSEDNARALITTNYSLEEEVYHVRDGKGGIRRIWLINRLDGPTTGVVLLATNQEAADAAKKCFVGRTVLKSYVAICLGRQRLASLRGVWNDLLTTRRGGPEGLRSEPVLPGQPPRGPVNPALTHVRAGLKGEGDIDLVTLHLEPKTGRTHQLRVQCALRGHAILGDRTYGDFEANQILGSKRGFRRLFLHAEKLELTPVINGVKVRFLAQSPLPAEFSEVLGKPRDSLGLGRVRL